MVQISSLVDSIGSNHTDIELKQSDDFAWSHEEKTLYYDPNGDPIYLLHELAHAILGHAIYKKDIELVQYERDAWEYAKKALAPQYDLAISDDVAEEALDTYRDWLHARSTCPACKANGVQTKTATYSCPSCLNSWRVNEAKTCGLKRYKIE